MTIKTVDDLKSYLDAQKIEYDSIEELTGGTANYVFRLTKSDGDSVILKHAEPFVRNNVNLAFPVERMDFEAAALSTVNSRLPHDEIVNAAQLHSYDKSQHVIIMSDGGAKNLKDAYADSSLDIPSLGKRLGAWLASLHQNTHSTDIGNNKVAKYIYQHSYQNLSSAMEKFGFDTDLSETMKSDFAPLLYTDDECVCHGDFWPGNVLVASDSKLTIVDWEMTRRGISATDVAQFSAESYLLDRFKGGCGLLEAFLSSYVASVGGKVSLSDEWKTRFAVHCGTHLGYWPTRVPWGDEEQTKEVVGLGRSIIAHGIKKDWLFLSSTPFAAVF